MTREAVAPCRVMAQVDAIAAPVRAPSRPVVATTRPRRTGRHRADDRRPDTAARHRAETGHHTGLGAVGVLDPTSGDHLVADPRTWPALVAAVGTAVVFAIPDTGALELIEAR